MMLRLLRIASIFLTALCVLAAPGHAAEDSIRTDITIKKIGSLLKAEKYAEALPYFDELEKSASALPESFYYYQIFCLSKTNDVDATMAKANTYLERYGKKGQYYAKVIDIAGEFGVIQDKRNKEAAVRNQKKKEEEATFARYTADYEKAYELFRIDFAERNAKVQACETRNAASRRRCNDMMKGTAEEKANWCEQNFGAGSCEGQIRTVLPPKPPVRP